MITDDDDREWTPDDYEWSPFHEKLMKWEEEEQERRRIRAECRRTCNGWCYRCLEDRCHRLCDDLFDASERGLKPQLALKFAAMVFWELYDDLVFTEFYHATDAEERFLHALKEM